MFNFCAFDLQNPDEDVTADMPGGRSKYSTYQITNRIQWFWTWPKNSSTFPLNAENVPENRRFRTPK